MGHSFVFCGQSYQRSILLISGRNQIILFVANPSRLLNKNSMVYMFLEERIHKKYTLKQGLYILHN